MQVLFFNNQTREILWHHIHRRLWELAQEVVESLLVLVALAQVVTEICINLTAVLHDVAISLEGLHVILHDLVDLLRVSFELTLQSLSEAFTRLPYLQLGVEVLEALLDKLDVQNTSHTLLRLAERLKFLL